jgi:UDP-glucose 4-epimerase
LKILVTGGAGFIGSNISDRLIEDGHQVVIIDNLSTGVRDYIPDDAHFYELDIRDEKIADVFQTEKPDMICHLAAQLDVRVSISNPLFDADVNIQGSLRLIDLCVKHDVKKVIFASTGGAIYGEDCIPADESMMPRPISGYGVAKLSVEQYLYCFSKIHGLDYVALRYANVYGPRQNAHGEAGVVAIFIARLLSGRPVTINGDGHQTRDFVFVKDVVSANLQALKLDKVGSYNIGTGAETSINEIYNKLADISGIKELPQYAPGKLGEQSRSVLDHSKAGRDLHWQPQIQLDQGLQETYAFFKQQID